MGRFGIWQNLSGNSCNLYEIANQNSGHQTDRPVQIDVSKENGNLVQSTSELVALSRLMF